MRNRRRASTREASFDVSKKSIFFSNILMGVCAFIVKHVGRSEVAYRAGDSFVCESSHALMSDNANDSLSGAAHMREVVRSPGIGANKSRAYLNGEHRTENPVFDESSSD